MSNQFCRSKQKTSQKMKLKRNKNIIALQNYKY